MGDAAKVGIDYVSSTSDEIKCLKNDFSTITKSGIKYFSLVRNSGKNQWCFLPAPQAPRQAPQAPQAPQEKALDSSHSKGSEDLHQSTTGTEPRQKPDIQCPDCGCLDVKKKGTRNGKTRYQCSDCGKNFSQ